VRALECWEEPVGEVVGHGEQLSLVLFGDQVTKQLLRVSDEEVGGEKGTHDSVDRRDRHTQ